MLSMINRNRIKDLAVVQEFEHLIGRLRGFLSQSFDADGNLIVADPNLAVFSVGDYKPSSKTADHSGWLLCDGRAVSRVTHKPLFDVVGTTYGAGDGSTTFNIPNLQGRFLLGKATAGTGSTIGSTGGSIDHTHTMGSHTHTISSDGGHSHTVDSHAHSIGAHSHTYSGTTDDGSGSAAGATAGVDIFPSLSNHTHAYSGTTNSDGGGNTGSSSPGTDSQGGHSHGGSTGSASAGTSGTANPPFLVGNFFIFTGVA